MKEQGIINITTDAQSQVVCPIRLEAFNYEYGIDIYPIITGAGDVTNPTSEDYNPNGFIFQQLGGTAPNFTWTDLQTGEDPATDVLKYVAIAEDFFRIKYTHTDGCTYYSNIVQALLS